MSTKTLESILAPLRDVWYSEDGFGQYPAWFAEGDTVTGDITGAIYPMTTITKRQYWGDVCGQYDVFHYGEIDDPDSTPDSECYYHTLTSTIGRAGRAVLADTDIDTYVLDELIEQLTHDINANPPPDDHAAVIMRGVLADLTALAESIGSANRFVIRATFQGGRDNHLSNPLASLDGREFDSRDEACEAIYAALEGVICGYGCEMIAKPPMPQSDLRISNGDDLVGCYPAVYRDGDVPTEREFVRGTGSDHWEEFPDEPLATDSLVDYLTDSDGQIGTYLICSEGVTNDEIERVADVIRLRNAYADECREFIYREGWATEDGVSVRVEEIA